MKNLKGQTSTELIIIVPFILLFTIYLFGQITDTAKTSIAMATAKMGFYEKTAKQDQSIQLKKINFLQCNQTLNLSLQTSPAPITFDQADIDELQEKAEDVSGHLHVCIAINQTLPQDCTIPPTICVE